MRTPLAATFVVLTLLLGACPARHTPQRPRGHATTKAVDVTLTSLSGAPLRLASYRGKPLVMMFFTTWCVPCQVQGARLQPVRAAVGDHRATFLAVSLDSDRRLVPTYLEAAGFTFPAAFADPEMVRQSPLGPTRDVPRILVLDREGRLVLDFYGPMEPRALLAVLKTIL